MGSPEWAALFVNKCNRINSQKGQVCGAYGSAKSNRVIGTVVCQPVTVCTVHSHHSDKKIGSVPRSSFFFLTLP